VGAPGEAWEVPPLQEAAPLAAGGAPAAALAERCRSSAQRQCSAPAKISSVAFSERLRPHKLGTEGPQLHTFVLQGSRI
jgi:hypothetical protein